MVIEHLFYSMAIAIIVGMLYYRLTGRDHSWIIILCAWAPDLDFILPIHHGAFHTIAAMLIFAVFIAFLLRPFGIRFFDSIFFATVGFGAHLFEDALVFKVGYRFLWPFSSEILGLGLFPNALNEENYVRDFFRVANTEVLIIGILFLIVAIIIRTYIEGPTWIRWYMPKTIYIKIFGHYVE